MITIGLLWHSLSSDNLGVGALTESQIAICRDAAERVGVQVRFVVFGTQGRLRYGPNDGSVRIGNRMSIKQMLMGRSAFLTELDDCDLVLDIGEGDSFTDLYGIGRFIFLIVSKIAVLAKGIPLLLSPQTIGPFDHWYTRGLSTVVMRRCVRVFARDGLSGEYLRHCGVVGNTDEVVDVAFRLPFTRAAQACQSRVAIGLNVSGLLFAGGYTGTNQFGLTVDYPALVRDLLRHWTTNPDNEVWLIPHVVPDHLPRDDDRVAIRQLAAEFPSARCAPEFKSPSEAKSFISGMDFVTGARMHACIAAFSAGVPVVPLAYSRKFNGLFSSLGYQWVADGKSLSNAEALAKTLQAFEERGRLAVDVQAGNRIATEKLDRYTQFIAVILNQCLARRGMAVAPAPGGV
jgi:polysaccharide pyruvyl transferase WcaK-like protein